MRIGCVRGIKTDRRAVWFFLDARGEASKKSVPPRRDTAFKRARWKAYRDMVDPRRLVFIDETWIKTNMVPLRGWGLRGQRLDARVPHGNWKTLNFIAALRHDRIEAPWVINGQPGGGMGGMDF